MMMVKGEKPGESKEAKALLEGQKDVQYQIQGSIIEMMLFRKRALSDIS